VLRSRLTVAAAVLLTMSLTAAVSACDGGGNEPAMVVPNEVYRAVIEWQLARDAADDGGQPTTATSEKPELPVVYVVMADGSQVGASVQAAVAHGTVDEAVVRFADSRDEALETDDEHQPVRDDGVLLSITPVDPEPARLRNVEVEVYRSVGDDTRWTLSIGATPDGGRVTTSSLLPV
jgi:hypothetical protein